MYNGSTDTKGVVINYKKILKGIQEGKWMDQVQNTFALANTSSEDYSIAKRLLPSTTFSGVFSSRSIDGLEEYSGMMVIDIDKLTQEQVAEYREALQQDQYVHAFFVSPSGNGLKILMKVDSAAEHHLAAFLCIEQYFKDAYGVSIDKSGKDVSRLCYISYDPDLYLNENCLTFHVEAESVQVNTKRGFDDRPDKFKGHVLAKNAKYIFGVCEKWTQRNHQYESGNRNNYIHVLSCNLNRCGVDETDTMMLIQNEYSDLPYKEIETTVGSAYRNYNEHNSVDVYEIEKGNVPEVMEEELSIHEQTIYDDTMELLRRGVKKNLILKLIKTFGASLEFTEEEISHLMKLAKTHYKKEADTDSMESESATDALMKAVEEYQDTGGISTGIAEFDDTLGGGLMPGQAYGAIGDGGTYKSLMAQSIGSNEAKDDGLCLYLNGEMSRLQLMDRVISKELGIDLINGLKDKTISIEDIPELVKRLEGVLKGNFIIVNNSGWTKESIIQTVNRIEQETGKKVTLIIADGLTQMEDSKKDEIKSAIFNSGELKEVAKATNAAVLVLIHVSGGIGKHIRDTSKYVRGGTKIINNLDAMFCFSLLIDEESSNLDQQDILYKQGIFYVRLIDKRGSGLVLNKIVTVQRPMKLEPQNVDPYVMEVKLN